MVRQASPAYREMLEYMRGWKHGCGANAKITETGPYADGYKDGTEARRVKTAEVQKRLGVTDEEIMLGVLR